MAKWKFSKNSAIQASGFTQPYTDPSSGMNLPNAWIQIEDVLFVPYSYVLMVYNIYVDLTNFQNGMAPVFPNLRTQVNYPSTDWTDNFDPDTMDVAGHNIQKQSISYLQGVLSA